MFGSQCPHPHLIGIHLLLNRVAPSTTLQKQLHYTTLIRARVKVNSGQNARILPCRSPKQHPHQNDRTVVVHPLGLLSSAVPQKTRKDQSKMSSSLSLSLSLSFSIPTLLGSSSPRQPKASRRFRVSRRPPGGPRTPRPRRDKAWVEKRGGLPPVRPLGILILCHTLTI